ncbi:MAG: DUF4352 domain-containing protein [Clostridiales bacterium]|nr:DUF4352 domain-containing protein [Clostridiales bacterium]
MMKRNLSIMLLSSTLLVGAVPVMAEDATNESLEERVDYLEQRVSDLEEQIAALMQLLNGPDKSDEGETSGSDQKEAPEGLIGCNEEVEIGDWIATMTGYSFEDEWSDGFLTYSAGDGNKYLLVDLTVTNNGTKADTFVTKYYAYDGDIEAKIYYQDKYEYNINNFMGSVGDDLSSLSIKPLETKEGSLIFKVPDAVASEDGSVTMELTRNKDTYNFQIK